MNPCFANEFPSIFFSAQKEEAGTSHHLTVEDRLDAPFVARPDDDLSTCARTRSTGNEDQIYRIVPFSPSLFLPHTHTHARAHTNTQTHAEHQIDRVYPSDSAAIGPRESTRERASQG